MRNGSRISVITSESTYALVVVATGPDFLLIEKQEEGKKGDLLPVLREDVHQIWAIASSDLCKDVRRTGMAAKQAEEERDRRKEARYRREDAERRYREEQERLNSRK